MARRLVAVIVTAALLTACGDGGGPTGDTGIRGEVTVFAASSLTEVFTTFGDELAAAYPGLRVTFNFAGSSTLARQLTDGAPADVFAAASQETMAQAGDRAVEPRVFARNVLQIVTPRGNPAGITGIADLAREDLRIALCAEQVPCGAAAATALAAAGVTARPDTLEQDVKATLTKVTLGEIDAALVYRTDVRAAGDAVVGIDFPEASEAVNEYLIATIAVADPHPGAAAFTDFARSPRGKDVLRAAGFDVP